MSAAIKSLSSLTDKALVKEYNRTHAKIDEIVEKLIEQGMGNVKPSELREEFNTTYANNETVREYLALRRYASELRCIAENRYGPGLILVDQLIWKKGF